MSAIRGFAGTFLGLTLLEATLASRGGVENTSGLVRIVTGAVRRVVDPSIPLIPDRREGHPS